jgi:DNA-binding beta-propeller fold protein YncE
VEAARPVPGRVAAQHETLDLVPVLDWGVQGQGEGQFQEPRDIAIDEQGQVYVADTGNRRIQVFDQEGNYLDQWTQADEPFVEPLAVVVNSRGEILVLDSTTTWIYRFSPQGDYLGKFAGPGAQLYHPRGMAIDGEDTVYVADTGGGRFILFDAQGNKSGEYGSMGAAPGQFLEPTDVAIDEWGDLYAVDMGNRRIQHMDIFGRYKQEWAIPLGNAFNGSHIDVAEDGSFFITAPEVHAVQRYGRDGNLLGQWGTDRLRIPVNLVRDGNRLYVTDTLNHRIQVFEIRERS